MYMFEDTGLDASHEVYGGREGQTACWGKNYVVSGQQLWRVEANYGVSGQQLRRVEVNYGVSGQFTSCRGKLRRHPCPQTSHNSSSTVYS